MKAAEPGLAAARTFAQVSARTTPKCSQLPKLIAQARRLGPTLASALVNETGSVAEAGGGAARHTRAWSVGATAVVADYRRLMFRRSGGGISLHLRDAYQAGRHSATGRGARADARVPLPAWNGGPFCG